MLACTCWMEATCYKQIECSCRSICRTSPLFETTAIFSDVIGDLFMVPLKWDTSRLLRWLKFDITNVFEKVNTRRRKVNATAQNGEKNYIFLFTVWKDLQLCHKLDVMHVGKDVRQCDWNFTRTLVYLKKMHIKDALHPIIRDDGNIILPYECHTKSTREHDIFCKVLHALNVSDRYSSYMSRCINLHHLPQLKTYEYHVWMNKFFH